MRIIFYFLGGDSKALMFVQISPNESDINETICSLNFASRVKGVEMGAAKKQLDTAEFIKYKQMVNTLSVNLHCIKEYFPRICSFHKIPVLLPVREGEARSEKQGSASEEVGRNCPFSGSESERQRS